MTTRSDGHVKQDVETELKWEPSVNDAGIGVAVHHGIVTLTGHVPNYAQKLGAEAATKRVAGVKAVANDVEVRPVGTHCRDDEAIASACLAALAANISIPEDKLLVTVKRGWVTLEGTLEWQYQRAEAEGTIRFLAGVTGVTNRIEIQPGATMADVKARIADAFQRNAAIDAKQIAIEAHGGKVALHGKVRTWAEREAAQTAAWSAPGVSLVVNDLSVGP